METGWYHLIRELELWAWGPQPLVPAFPAERLLKDLDELCMLSIHRIFTWPFLLPGGLPGRSHLAFSEETGRTCVWLLSPSLLCHLWLCARADLTQGWEELQKCSPGKREDAICKGRPLPSLSPEPPHVVPRSWGSIRGWAASGHSTLCPRSLGETPAPLDATEAWDLTKPQCPICEMHRPCGDWTAGSWALVLLHLSGDYFLAVSKGKGSRFWVDGRTQNWNSFQKIPLSAAFLFLHVDLWGHQGSR